MRRSNLPTERKRRFPLCLKTAPASSLRPFRNARRAGALHLRSRPSQRPSPSPTCRPSRLPGRKFLCGLALIFRRVFEICVGVDARIGPREVTNSPQISVKRSDFAGRCRHRPPTSPIGEIPEICSARRAARTFILPRKPSAFHFPAHNHTAHDRGLRRSRPSFRGARARG